MPCHRPITAVSQMPRSVSSVAEFTPMAAVVPAHACAESISATTTTPLVNPSHPPRSKTVAAINPPSPSHCPKTAPPSSSPSEKFCSASPPTPSIRAVLVCSSTDSRSPASTSESTSHQTPHPSKNSPTTPTSAHSLHPPKLSKTVAANPLQSASSANGTKKKKAKNKKMKWHAKPPKQQRFPPFKPSLTLKGMARIGYPKASALGLIAG